MREILAYSTRLYGKDGATTDTGRGGFAEAVILRVGTADIKTLALSYRKGKTRHFPPVDRQLPVCARGDSGVAFLFPIQRNGWKWIGQLVSMLNVENGSSLGLMVPQSKIFQSLENTSL